MPATTDFVAPIGSLGPSMIDPRNGGYNAASVRLFNPHAPGDNPLSNRLFNPETNPNTWGTTLTSTPGAAAAAASRPGAVSNVFDMTRIGMQQATFDPNYRGIVSAFRHGAPTVGPPDPSGSAGVVNSAMNRL